MGAKLRLLCAAAVLLCAAPPGQPSARGAVAAVLPAGEGDGYGVKLCGREFIRAVIFTCGGSRWKRLSLLAMEPPPAAGECPRSGRAWAGPDRERSREEKWGEREGGGQGARPSRPEPQGSVPFPLPALIGVPRDF